jgi:hypothetical protein
MTMNALTTIEFSSLSLVHGGQETPAGPTTGRSGIFENGAGPIRNRVAAGLNVTLPTVQATGQGTYESTDNNFSACLANTTKGTPERLKCFDQNVTGTGTGTGQ